MNLFKGKNTLPMQEIRLLVDAMEQSVIQQKWVEATEQAALWDQKIRALFVSVPNKHVPSGEEVHELTQLLQRTQSLIRVIQQRKDTMKHELRGHQKASHASMCYTQNSL